MTRKQPSPEVQAQVQAAVDDTIDHHAAKGNPVAKKMQAGRNRERAREQKRQDRS